MYHSRVTSKPRSVEATIVSTDESPPLNTRFIGASPYSFGNANPWPVGFLRAIVADAREYTRFLGTPRSTSSTFWRGMPSPRSEEHTSELQSHSDLVCRLLREKKK